jgi:hypothetical protein
MLAFSMMDPHFNIPLATNALTSSGAPATEYRAEKLLIPLSLQEMGTSFG